MISRFFKCWQKNYLRNELLLGVLLVSVFAVWCEWIGGRELVAAWLKDARNTLYPAFISLFGSLFGFIITAMSIIVTWVDRDKFVKLRGRPGYPDLWRTFYSAVKWLAIASIASVLAMVLDKEPPKDVVEHQPPRWVWYILALAVATALLRLARCVWVLESLINIVAAPIKSTVKKESASEPDEKAEE